MNLSCKLHQVKAAVNKSSIQIRQYCTLNDILRVAIIGVGIFLIEREPTLPHTVLCIGSLLGTVIITPNHIVPICSSYIIMKCIKKIL